MPAQWTQDLVGKMHGKVAKKELAQYMGIHPKYVSAILNGKRTPKNAQAKFEKALDEILEIKST